LLKGITFGGSLAIMYVLYVVGFVYGGYLIQVNAASTVGMLRAILCAMFGIFGAGIAMSGVQDRDVAKIAAYDLFGIIDRKSNIDAIEPSGSHEDLGDGSIEFTNVRFAFPHRPDAKVLQGVSFKVDAGQMIALVGPSGSGKSTIIQMLLRFYDPTAGAVLIGGTDLREYNISWFRRQTGFVGQEPILFNMSLEDNVKYGLPDASHQEVLAAAKIAAMDYVLGTNGAKKLIEWGDSVGPKGSKLSGGQKQRVAIARAVIRNPKIMVLDEATSALDSQSEQIVQKAIDEAAAHRTVFTIAHRFENLIELTKIYHS
jgi:ABC-type multidrug transport system fused ATPase/permease subunit